MNVLVNLVTVGYTLFFIEEQNVILQEKKRGKVVTKFLNCTVFQCIRNGNCIIVL